MCVDKLRILRIFAYMDDTALLKKLGVSEVAKRLGRPYTTVQSWADRPRGIPREYLLAVVELAREQGLDITVEGLLSAQRVQHPQPAAA